MNVLNYGANLMACFFKVQHLLRNVYGKVTHETNGATQVNLRKEIVDNMEEFDIAWSNF